MDIYFLAESTENKVAIDNGETYHKCLRSENISYVRTSKKIIHLVLYVEKYYSLFPKKYKSILLSVIPSVTFEKYFNYVVVDFN